MRIKDNIRFKRSDDYEVDVVKDNVKVNYSDIELIRLLSRFIYHLNSDSGF